MEKSDRNRILFAFIPPLLLLLISWVVWYFDKTENLSLYKLGIYPRDISGLKGILFSPFVHSTDDYAHIVNNSIPLFFLTWALFYFYKEIALPVFLLIWGLTETWVWVGAKEAFHIGISGILYGLVTFLFYSGVLRKNKNLLGLTLLVTFLYGGMVWGVLPYDISISWESHLFGAIAGILLAIYYRKKGPSNDYQEWPEEKEPPFLIREDGTKDYDFWKTEEQKKKEEGMSNDKEKMTNQEIKINYEYKKKEEE